MKNTRSIFYIVYLLFHVALLGIAIFVNVNGDDFEFLIELRNYIPWMTYAAIFGLVLFVINLMILSMEGRNRKKEKSALEQEANSYKAKMFDLQEATKSAPLSGVSDSSDTADIDNSGIE